MHSKETVFGGLQPPSELIAWVSLDRKMLGGRGAGYGLLLYVGSGRITSWSIADFSVLQDSKVGCYLLWAGKMLWGDDLNSR